MVEYENRQRAVRSLDSYPVFAGWGYGIGSRTVNGRGGGRRVFRCRGFRVITAVVLDDDTSIRILADVYEVPIRGLRIARDPGNIDVAIRLHVHAINRI